MIPETDRPLILTFRMDAQSQAFFDALRETYFPPERHYLKAHVTAFHQLPQAEFAKIDASITVAAAETRIFSCTVTGVKFLGFGSAFKLQPDRMTELRNRISQNWNYVIPQDKNFQPHITVQNKVAPGIAKNLYQELCRDFESRDVIVEGLDLWRYDSGPWQHFKRYDFNR